MAQPFFRPADRPRGIASADAALGAFVVLVVGLMIVPLPTWTLDLLISANLSASIAVLLVVLYVPDAIGIATFPTLLLLTTLYRLALNVASTRLILLQADAGQVIRAFGAFVVKGNYVVGAVVFLVLTIIQFVVIAKGSERVAEVGARFALDAMPGKQMSIDAELRSGTIDGGEARRRRRQLQRESQFYGAMDGAMKFVKGDVIASLVILVVNLVGGFAIGVVMKDLPLVAALRRYGLLTIGDGLVTQIPALVLSTAAGVLVTRVASEEADTPLGEELARQLLGVPKALNVASVFVLLLAAMPGLPGPPFFVMGAALWVVGRARARAKNAELRRAAAEPTPKERMRPGTNDPAFLPMVVPWSIEVSPDLEPLLDAEPGGLRGALLDVRERLFAELGVPAPAPRLRVRPGLDPRQIVVAFHEVPARVLRAPDDLQDNDALTAWLCDRALGLLRGRAADFLGLAEVQRLLDELEQFAPATVRNVVPKPVSLVLLTDVLRRLVEERVSVRDLRGILEALSGMAQNEKDGLSLTEYVRSQMRRALTFRLTAGAGQLEVVVLDPMLEDTVRRAITRTAAGSFLALPPAAARDVLASIHRAMAEATTRGHVDGRASEGAGKGPHPVILTQPDIRRFVRKLLETEPPDSRVGAEEGDGPCVVSFAELLPEVAIKPIARALPA